MNKELQEALDRLFAELNGVLDSMLERAEQQAKDIKVIKAAFGVKSNG